MKQSWTLGVLLLVAMVLCVCQGVAGDESASLIEPYNIAIEGAAVCCRPDGHTVVTNALANGADWAFRNYEERLRYTVGAGEDGKGLLRVTGVKEGDSAWHLRSRPFPLTGEGDDYLLLFSVASDVPFKDPLQSGEGYNSALAWFDAEGKKIASEPIPHGTGATSVPCPVLLRGKIPAGARAVSIQFGFDLPNLPPEKSVTYRDVGFYRIDTRAMRFTREAGFVSAPHAGGQIAWRADLPEGCALAFQWRGADDLDTLSEQPFRGPDNTPATAYTAPFAADAPYIQYRVTLTSNGRVTPRLHAVSTDSWRDAAWSWRRDCQSPYVRVVSETPTTNRFERLRLSATDAAGIAWKTLRVVVDGKDETTLFSRDGNVLTRAVSAEPWTNGLHTVQVTVADTLGNARVSEKRFWVGASPVTDRITLRDDGITLINGKPFFPIGLYAVCKREFNGMNLDTAFKGLRDAGFNFAHTYGNSYEPDFLAAAEKYGMRLWVAARFPDRNLLETGRAHPGVLAWYLGDDTADHIPPDEERDYHDAVKAVDPNRLTTQADGFSPRYSDYVNATDTFMPEIYPVRGEAGDPSDRTCVARTIQDMQNVAEEMREHGNGMRHAIWPIIQYFKGWSSWKHFPTRDQLFAMSFAAIIQGAHGITWYTYGGFKENEGVTSTPERWKAICDLAGRLSELSPVLVERTPEQVPPARVTQGPALDPLGKNPSVTHLLKRHGDACYLFAVNAAPEEVAVQFTVPERAGEVEVLYEGRRFVFREGGFADTFQPFAVHIYRFK
ncbi:MAG: hypothetical protein J6334_09745 [Kiritimatiellae bacterium]|nr:hypothetical protein [Kiritimatiellia bacterium]